MAQVVSVISLSANSTKLDFTIFLLFYLWLEIDFINFIAHSYQGCRGILWNSLSRLSLPFSYPATHLVRWELSRTSFYYLRNGRLRFYAETNDLTSCSDVKSSHYSCEIGYILCIRCVEICLSLTHRSINQDFSHNCRWIKAMYSSRGFIVLVLLMLICFSWKCTINFSRGGLCIQE